MIIRFWYILDLSQSLHSLPYLIKCLYFYIINTNWFPLHWILKICTVCCSKSIFPIPQLWFLRLTAACWMTASVTGNSTLIVATAVSVILVIDAGRILPETLHSDFFFIIQTSRNDDFQCITNSSRYTATRISKHKLYATHESKVGKPKFYTNGQNDCINGKTSGVSIVLDIYAPGDKSLFKPIMTQRANAYTR